ncbi:MAG: 50S ribosomal protein L17 [candidate division Zixibacteria bacterium]|nr:50S ribosomal protein L17 [candidate division Zixibacteria bacterium]
MRHGRTVRKLGRTASHRKAMLGNMATSLFRAHAVVTTAPKARVIRSVAEKLITLGKRGDMHARRLASRQVKDRTILKKLFDEIAPQFASRQGGYTRVVKLGWRRGDGATLAKVELLVPKAVPTASEEHSKKKAADKAAAAEKVAKEKGKKAKAEA